MQKSISRLAAVALLLAAIATPARAADIYWDGTSTLWGSVVSWDTSVNGTGGNPAAVPGASDIADFSINTINSAQVVNLGADQSALGLVFLGTNTATTTLQSNSTTARALTLGTSGITVNSGAGAVTIGSVTNAVNITLNGTQSWTNNSANALTVETDTASMAYTLTVGGTGNTFINGYLGASGSGSLTGGLIKTGSGTLTLSSGGLSFYTGTTTVAQGTLSAAGIAGYLGNGGAVTLGSTGNTGTLEYTGSSSASTTRVFTMTGTGEFDITQATMNMGVDMVAVLSTGKMVFWIVFS